jgi:hypothetical protein
MGTVFGSTGSISESESPDPVGESLRRFLDPFLFTSLRSLWLLASESLELPESEPEMEAAMFGGILLLRLFTGPSRESLVSFDELVVVLRCCSVVDHFSP